MRRPVIHVAALGVALLLAGCGSSPPAGPTKTPAPATGEPVGTGVVSATGVATTSPAAGEPCSFLTAEQVAAILGSVPIQVEERVGRGDCDYWLTSAKDAKVNIGVTTGPDSASVVEGILNLGDPKAVELGDEAYSIFNASIGTLVVVRQGDTVATVQVLNGSGGDEQLRQAVALATAVIAGL